MVGSLSVQPGSSACTCAWPNDCEGIGWLVCRGCGGDTCDCRCGGCQECSGCKACKEMALEGNTLPKPYYEEDGITIYNADCRDILPHLPKVDLVLTDPPYGLSWSGTGFKKQPLLDHKAAKSWDERPNRDTLIALVGIGRQYVIWGGNYFAGDLGPCAGILVWHKLTGTNPFADGEAAWSNVSGTMRIFTHQWCGAFKDSERNIRNAHPTQKPVTLMAWCINLADEPSIILDPFMGSGTTLVAAKRLGRRAIGIEIEEKYCAIAVQRLAQEVLPLSAPEEPKPEQLPLGLEVTA
jgi:16S rRNA G966 N2-methylase RsmD